MAGRAGAHAPEAAVTYRVYVRRLAELDAIEGQAWYEAKQQGLGDTFNLELGLALQRLEHMPLKAQRVYGAIRRAVVRRFPYLLWYVVEGQDVIVLACTHGKRGRQFIRTRLA